MPKLQKTKFQTNKQRKESHRLMKPLLPTLKEKKRYVLFKIISEGEISKQECSEAINSACLRVLGELTAAKAGIVFLDENYSNNQGIIRINTKYIDHLKLTLASIQQIGKHKAIVTVTSVSGLVNVVKEKL